MDKASATWFKTKGRTAHPDSAISTHAIEHKTMACLKMSISKVGCAHGQTLVFICEKFVTSVMNTP
jgi:hypothetical protein